MKACLIGGGIASLASAAYLIKDGNIPGESIYIFEESGDIGGSLDAKGTPETRYVSRGGRMFTNDVYKCMFDLMSFIPLEKGSRKTLLDDYNEFNEEARVNAKARLVAGGKTIDSSNFGLSAIDKINILKMISLPESFFHDTAINDHFSEDFFKTNFWFEWCTIFAFEPWHSAVEFQRYALRFVQEFPNMSTMAGVRYTRYTQYESIILPLVEWLKEKGVNFLMDSRVTYIDFIKDEGTERVNKIVFSRGGIVEELTVDEKDLVFFTNGSMTGNSAFGDKQMAPVIKIDTQNDSFALWKKVAEGRPQFGKPEVFSSDIDKSKWESFSVTLKDRTLMNLLAPFSQTEKGAGGITTIIDSNWLISIGVPPHPHFKNQTDNVYGLWGYGLYPDKEGNFVHKKMSECSGEEILTEVCSHLGFQKELPEILKSADSVPCMMPYITSQFMVRKNGDRPEVLPAGTKNFAFIGQFCEIPNDIVFTVEYSIRSAMIAVRGLLNIDKKIPDIYQGLYSPTVIKDLLRTVLG